MDFDETQDSLRTKTSQALWTQATVRVYGALEYCVVTISHSQPPRYLLKYEWTSGVSFQPG
eukprot:gene7426-5343_t